MFWYMFGVLEVKDGLVTCRTGMHIQKKLVDGKMEPDTLPGSTTTGPLANGWYGTIWSTTMVQLNWHTLCFLSSGSDELAVSDVDSVSSIHVCIYVYVSVNDCLLIILTVTKWFPSLLQTMGYLHPTLIITAVCQVHFWKCNRLMNCETIA